MYVRCYWLARETERAQMTILILQASSSNSNSVFLSKPCLKANIACEVTIGGLLNV
jgi:hypothetical protein